MPTSANHQRLLVERAGAWSVGCSDNGEFVAWPSAGVWYGIPVSIYYHNLSNGLGITALGAIRLNRMRQEAEETWLETPLDAAEIIAARPDNFLLSVVVPCFNENDVIGLTHGRLVDVLGSGPIKWSLTPSVL
jgi:hypothetical protein